MPEFHFEDFPLICTHGREKDTKQMAYHNYEKIEKQDKIDRNIARISKAASHLESQV